MKPDVVGGSGSRPSDRANGSYGCCEPLREQLVVDTVYGLTIHGYRTVEEETCLY